MPFLAAIISALSAIGVWLSGAWTAAVSALVTYTTLRYGVMAIIALAWLASFVALLLTIHSLLPTQSLSSAQSSMQSHDLFGSYFLPWFAYLKPAGLSTYLSSILATWVAARVWQTWWVVLDIKRS